MRFLAFTGWRAGEAMALRWTDVDFEAGVVRLEPGTTKNGGGREFSFGAFRELTELMQDQRAHTTAVELEHAQIIGHVFHRDGHPARSYAKAWKRACREAGLSGRLAHDRRCTAVRNLERAGVSRSVAMKLTGHKTEAVYRGT